MSLNLKNFVYGAILLGGGLYLGRMIGIAQVYKETGNTLVLSHLQGASTNLNSHIKLLQLLQRQDYQKVSEALEKLVNVDLIALSEYQPSVSLKNEVLSSIEKAKLYREKYPISNDPETEKAINKAFMLVK